MTITCIQMFQFEHPYSDCYCEIKNSCPCDRNYVTDRDHMCEDFEHNCTLCWNQPATNPEKLAKIEKDAEKSWGDRIAENLAKANDDICKTIKNEYEHILEKSKIKDSGERREFETGAVRDIQEGKGRCDLMPLDVVADWFKHSYEYDERVQKVFYNIEKFKETGSVDYLYEVLSYGNTMFVNSETMFLDVAKHFEAGAVKYGENNWQKGIPVHCYIDSAVRHYLKFLRGDDDEPHDRAFVWNIMCCIWTCIHKPDLNDFCEVKEAVEPKGYNPVERAYQMLVDIRDHSEDDDVHMSDVDDIIGYLGEALND